MIRHHPADELLLGLAAGTLGGGHALVTAVHVEACSHCQARLHSIEALGGALLEELPPAEMRADALARTLAAIDQSPPKLAVSIDPIKATLPNGLPWPQAMQGCEITRWRWMAPGMRWARVYLPHDKAAKLFLLRIGAGMTLAQHTHSRSELTQVMYGSFDDGRATFAQGDFDETDGEVNHQPAVVQGGECVCLASVEGKVLFEGVLARTLGAMIGM